MFLHNTVYPEMAKKASTDVNILTLHHLVWRKNVLINSALCLQLAKQDDLGIVYFKATCSDWTTANFRSSFWTDLLLSLFIFYFYFFGG